MDSAETPSWKAWMNLRTSRSTAASSWRPCDRLARCSHAQPVLAHVLAAEILEEVSAHQLVAQRSQDPLLHLLAVDRQAIGARAT